eukprot:scaffold9139_cov64-Phaeocystis_antarctica.AAC.11
MPTVWPHTSRGSARLPGSAERKTRTCAHRQVVRGEDCRAWCGTEGRGWRGRARLGRAHLSAAPCSEPMGEGRCAMQCSTSGGGISSWPDARLAAFSRAIVSAASCCAATRAIASAASASFAATLFAAFATPAATVAAAAASHISSHSHSACIAASTAYSAACLAVAAFLAASLEANCRGDSSGAGEGAAGEGAAGGGAALFSGGRHSTSTKIVERQRRDEVRRALRKRDHAGAQRVVHPDLVVIPDRESERLRRVGHAQLERIVPNWIDCALLDRRLCLFAARHLHYDVRVALAASVGGAQIRPAQHAHGSHAHLSSIALVDFPADWGEFDGRAALGQTGGQASAHGHRAALSDRLRIPVLLSFCR